MDSRTEQFDAPSGGAASTGSAGSAPAANDDLSFQIEGMSCANCARARRKGTCRT